jgi:hypothetical protein
MREQFGLELGSRICDNCRKALYKPMPPIEEISEEPYTVPSPPSPEFSSSPSSPEYTDFQQSEALEKVSECLVSLGKTPFNTRKASRSKIYAKQKVAEITSMMDGLVIGEDQRGGDREIIQQLKEKFHSTSERSVKVQVLTVLPMSWSVNRIQEEFGASNYMARRAKQLVREHGILATPDPRPGRPNLPESVVDQVTTFYENDSSSRMMPGKKDYVSIITDHGRVHKQKRLVLGNLKELYQAFKNEHPTLHIGFTKFAELRPKHCILAGASGTHAVCVCTIHQNVKLMLEGVKIQRLSSIQDPQLTNYHCCIAQLVCNPALPRCYLRECDFCPGIYGLKECLVKRLDENLIDEVTFKQWTAVDRSTLETVTLPSDEFVDALCERLEALQTHSFIAKQQSQFYDQCKQSLKPAEIVVSGDFSENYSFILQDAAQGFHWNNSQSTIHPFVIYFNDLSHASFVVISDCMSHDTIAVYLFQKRLISFLRSKLGCLPKKIYYFSDGASSQYKNRKNFVNLCLHNHDFGIKAEWHFAATSHGKGACDGLGGTVKRLAAKASLQRPYEDQIMTPFQLYEWASKNIPSVTFVYCTTEEYEREKSFLEDRFQKSRTIAGTRSLHAFIPKSTDTMTTKRFSLSTISKDVKVMKERGELEMEEVSGYVICIHNNQWWLGCVLEKDLENVQVKLSLLHPSGPSRSFRYPRAPEIVTVPLFRVILLVEPRTTTGRTYTIPQSVSKAASTILKDTTST